MKRHATVIGAGIVGLWTALVLLDRGHRVTIRSKSQPSSTFSAAAAAVITPLLPWEPSHPSFSRCWGWYRRTLNKYRELNDAQPNGKKLLEPMPSFECGFEQDGHMLLEKDFSVKKFQHLPFADVAVIPISPPVSVENHTGSIQKNSFCASFVADFCNTEYFLEFLFDEVVRRGASFSGSPLRSSDHLAELESDAIFNCMGADSAGIFPDSQLTYVRGQSIFIPDKLAAPPYFGVASGHHAIFKHRRGYYVGSYFLENEPCIQRTPTRIEYELSAKFVTGPYPDLCRILGLPAPKINLGSAVRMNTGIRPFREDGPRVEVDDSLLSRSNGRTRLVHNYGHGAHGWTIGFATAEDAVNLAEIRGWLS